MTVMSYISELGIDSYKKYKTHFYTILIALSSVKDVCLGMYESTIIDFLPN